MRVRSRKSRDFRYRKNKLVAVYKGCVLVSFVYFVVKIFGCGQRLRCETHFNPYRPASLLRDFFRNRSSLVELQSAPSDRDFERITGERSVAGSTLTVADGPALRTLEAFTSFRLR